MPGENNQSIMIEKISDYIKEQSCANVCCVDEFAKPYCFNCFYAYNAADQLLYYKSSTDTKHSGILFNNPAIAGTILPDKLNKLQVRGLQFEGEVLSFSHPLCNGASAFYHKKNPVALAMPGEVWTIQINKLKFTDTALGFGKKLLWQRNEQHDNAVTSF